MSVLHFIGLGTMGAPMVRRLTAAGYAVGVSDAAPAVAENLAAETGARHVPDARSNDGVDIVILMLPNSDVVGSVLGDPMDPASLWRSLQPGAIVVDMGSSNPEATRDNGIRAADLGVEFVDAPVSGGVAKALSGELAIMVGSRDEEIFERIRPLLSAMGASVTRIGPIGSGHALKALNNLLSVIGLVGGLETLAVGKEFGIDPQVMLDVINKSTGMNHATAVKISQQVLTRRFGVGFSLALTVKDITTAQSLARANNIHTPLSDAAVQVAVDALEYLGEAGPDQSQIAEFIEATNGFTFTR